MDALRKIGLADSAAQQAQRPVNPILAETPHSNVFGLDVFRGATSRFDPMTAGPVDANYRVGPRDVVALILTGGIEASYTLEVTGEGYVVIPQVGQVFVSNLTLDQIRNLLYDRLGRVYSGVTRRADASTKFSVSVARVRANQIFVIGEAGSPGSYQVSSAGTMLTALYAAGGPSTNGNMRAVELRRGGRLLGTLDLYDYLIRGDASRDLRLESGDVIFIPFHGKRATIKGEVGRPAIFELLEAETLQDLIRYAGGLSPTAANHRIQIRRILTPQARTAPGFERVVLDVSADQLAGGNVPAFPIVAGDQVEVFGVTDVERNQISVVGHVWAPGELGLKPGMTLSEAIAAAGGVRPGVFLERVLVTRQQSGSAPMQLRTSFADSTGRLTADIPLREGDHVRVFSRTEFAQERTITVSGAVKAPVQVPFREGMTLRDAILLAGGLRESAYLREVEVARLPDNPSAGALAVARRVPLDSTYLFERGPDGKYLGPPGVAVPPSGNPEFPLKPYDNVLVLLQPDYASTQRVRIYGEVRFPGAYTLRSQDERISDLVARAGGLSTQAYADGATFTRQSDNVGRISFALRDVMRDPDTRENFKLLAGDSIFVPHFLPTVKVTGGVNAPGNFAYRPGARLTEYVELAGGFARNADEGRSYVLQANGATQVLKQRRLRPDTVPEPEPGATIVVPTKEDDKRDLTVIATSIAQLVSALVTTVLVIRRF
jgi:protein involved in polysaccharide export with SLBB domain